MKVRDKVAVVTGAGSGIGRQTSILLAEHGAKVVISDRSESGADMTASMISKEVGGDAETHVVRADVGEEADIEALAAACRDRFGRVDVLINNAAMRLYGTVTEMDRESWDQIFAVNLRGAALASKNLIPLMTESGGGSIVIVSSVHAIAGRPGMIQYDTMKAGLLGMTRSLACDHAADGIRVNAVLPGLTLTDYHIKRAQDAGQTIDLSVTEVPYEGGPGLLRRQATPREIAYPIVFLASDDASYMTGACVPVDGGVSAHGPST
jgi:NAD(P)-dependent dehydrogenase (short-subunit alcohol dehydrogenase family)